MNCQIAESFIELITLFQNEQKQTNDYGTGIKINHIEASFLDTIYRHPDANVSCIARKLGVTKGAVTQTYGKLIEKGLVDSFMRSGNKKEKYFRLTETGEATRHGHQRYHEEANKNLCHYFSSLNENEAKVVFDFLEHLKQCVPFCEFTCQCGNADHSAKEADDETDTNTNNQSPCSTRIR